MPKLNDLSRSRVALNENTTLIAVIEMGLASWLIGGRVPGVNRSPLRKLDPDPKMLLARLHRWRDEAIQAGRMITRIAVAYEAGRDGFWLARWLSARGIETYVMHPTSIPVKRDHRRAKTDRLDTALLMRAFLGWLRGEADHCSMALKQMRTPEGVAIPTNTLAELERDLARLGFIREQSRAIEKTRVTRLNEAPLDQPHAMVLMLAKVRGIGIETADMLVNEVLCRNLRDRRAVARYAGMTGSPDESGAKRREKGLAKAGNSRVRRGMLQLAWRWLMFQKDSALSQWYKARTEHAPERTRKTMIVALARKLLIALWRYTTIGEIPEGTVLRAAG